MFWIVELVLLLATSFAAVTYLTHLSSISVAKEYVSNCFYFFYSYFCFSGCFRTFPQNYIMYKIFEINPFSHHIVFLIQFIETLDLLISYK